MDGGRSLFSSFQAPKAALLNQVTDTPSRGSGLWGVEGLSASSYAVNETFVERCMAFIDDKVRPASVVDLYSVRSSNESRVTALKALYLKQGTIFSLPSTEKVQHVASLLRSFYVDMETPLLTLRLYSSFIAVADKLLQTGERSAILDVLSSLLMLLPQANFDLLKRLFHHLHHLSLKSERKDLTQASLAASFVGLLLPQSLSPLETLADVEYAFVLIHTMIAECANLFEFNRPSLEEPTIGVLDSGYQALRAKQAHTVSKKLRKLAKTTSQTEVDQKVVLVASAIKEDFGGLPISRANNFHVTTKALFAYLKKPLRDLRESKRSSSSSDSYTTPHTDSSSRNSLVEAGTSLTELNRLDKSHEDETEDVHVQNLLGLDKGKGKQKRNAFPKSHREIGTLISNDNWDRSDSDSDDKPFSALKANHKSKNGNAHLGTNTARASFTVPNEEDSFSESADGVVDWDTMWTHLKSGWKIWIVSLFFVCAVTSKMLSMNLWFRKLYPAIEKAPNNFSAYVVILYGSLFLVVVAALGAAMCWLAKGKPPAPVFRENWMWYLGAGSILALGNVLVSMVGYLNRTPHLVEVIAMNTRYLWTIPFSLLLIPGKSKYKFAHGFILLAGTFMVGAIGLLLVPIIASLGVTEFSNAEESGVWSFLFIVGSICLGIGPVFLEKFYFIRKRLTVGRSGTFDTFMLGLCTALFQFVIVCALFWFDRVPVLGMSDSIALLGQTMATESQCLFEFGQCPDSVWMGFMHVLSWYVELLLMIKLAKDSAIYTQVLSTVAVPLFICFWIAFPWWEIINEFPVPYSRMWQAMPLWSVLPALLFFLLGSLVYKIWEMRQNSLIRPNLGH